MKKVLCIVLALMFTLSVAGCAAKVSSQGSSKLTNAASSKAEESKAEESKAESTADKASADAKSVSDEDKLTEIYNFAADKIWNEGFNNVHNYCVDGKTHDGKTIDIKSTLSQLEDTMDKVEEYDSYINHLSDPKYDKAKEAWKTISFESTMLYTKVKVKKPVIHAKSSDIINTNDLSDAIDDFTDELDKILE